MDLDRGLAGLNQRGDLLVKKAGDDQGEYFSFAARQRPEAVAQYAHFRISAVPQSVLFQCDLDGIEQILIPKGLREKFDRARFHRAHCHGDIAVGRDENDGDGSAVGREFTLELQAAHFGQSDIENDATGDIGTDGPEEFRGGSHCFDAETD
jgi:hypothetical protein